MYMEHSNCKTRMVARLRHYRIIPKQSVTENEELRNSAKKGITLLLVVVILSALLSISIGIFNVVFGELLISGEIADSFVAYYAADEGAEKNLYLDRIAGGLTDGTSLSRNLSSGGCYTTMFHKNPPTPTTRCSLDPDDLEIETSGQYPCGATPSRVVRRGWCVFYEP